MIQMVVGSWYRYNNAEELSLGSTWLDLDDFYDEDELIEELKKQGFELDGVDEELFVQDIDGYPIRNADNTNPIGLFKLIKESEILEDEYKYALMEAYCEEYSSTEWERLVEENGSHWDDGMYLYKNQKLYQIAADVVTEFYPEILSLPEIIQFNIDYEEILKRDECFTETKFGVLYNTNI